MSVVAGVVPVHDAATPGTSRRRTHPARSRHLRAVTAPDLREHVAGEEATPAPAAPARCRGAGLEATPPADTAGLEVARSWRLTRRGRAVVLGLLVALLTVGAVGFGAAQAIGASTAPTDRRVEVIVGEGDTLWSIAASVAPHGDRTETVQRIREANDLGNAHIEPGQQLVVPIPAS